MFDDGFLDEQFDPADPLAVGPRPAYLDPSGATAWGAEYPDEFRALMPELAGYVHYDDADVPGSPGGYYTVGARHRYDVHDPHRVPRGLPLGSLDAFGAESRVGYDHHDLLPTVAVDPVGLATRADNDLRILQPRRVTDPNGNTSRVRFSPAGFVTAHFVRGKNGEGDATVPSVRMEYDLLAFAERRPARVRCARSPGCTTTPTPTCPPTGATTRSSRSSTPTGSGACCRPAPRPRTCCSATPCSAVECSPPTRPSRSRRRSVGPGRPAPPTT